MKKHFLKIIGIFFLIVTCIVGFRWLYLYELENLPSAQFSRFSKEDQAKAKQFQSAFDAGKIVQGTILVFKDGKIYVFAGKRSENDFCLLEPTREVPTDEMYMILNVKECYTPNVTGQKMKERRFLLDQFVQGKLLKSDWRKQVE